MTEPNGAADAAIENMDEVEDFTSDKVTISTFDRYKGIGGRTDRIAIISPKITRALVHFHNQKGFRCLTTDEANPAICCQSKGAPEQKFGVVVFQYTTDETGALVDDQRCKGLPKLWVISESKFGEIRNVARQWPLLDKGDGTEQYDLLIKCTDDKWQRMDMSPCRNAHWKAKPEWAAAVRNLVPKATERLQRTVGQERDEAEVKEILGIQTALRQDQGGANEVDLSDVMGD